MNLHRVESQLANLERLVPHLTQYGCDLTAQDAARALMRYFDSLRERPDFEDDLMRNEDQQLGSAYAQLRGRLKEIANGRSPVLPIEQVAAFTRFYREHLLRAESVLVHPAPPRSASAFRLDS